MKKSKLIPTSLLLAALIAVGLIATDREQIHAAESATGANWLTDFEAAQATARAEGKPLLLDFTGSDWCIWCIRLTDEVFSREAFVSYADASLVLAKIDFPMKKPQSEELVAQNRALAEKFGIQGFPTIILLSPEGELLAKTGYQRGGPEAYVAHLQKFLADAPGR